MVARGRALFRTDPTDLLLELAQLPAPAPRLAVSSTASWGRRTAAVAAGVPVTLGLLSFGVAQATVHGHLGVAEGGGAVYVAALVDHAQVNDQRVVTAMRDLHVTAAVAPGLGAPTPTDVRALVGAGVTVVGADPGADSRNPNRQRAAIDAAAATVRVTGGEEPKVVCLHTPGMVERVVAWDHEVQLARPDEVVMPLHAAQHLAPGRQVVLDERGRTPDQLLADLAAFRTSVRSAGLPLAAMRSLWA